MCPGRPIQAVKKYVQREYDPRGNQGPWSKEEDADLKRSVAHSGLAIGAKVAEAHGQGVCHSSERVDKDRYDSGEDGAGLSRPIQERSGDKGYSRDR